MEGEPSRLLVFAGWGVPLEGPNGADLGEVCESGMPIEGVAWQQQRDQDRVLLLVPGKGKCPAHCTLHVLVCFRWLCKAGACPECCISIPSCPKELVLGIGAAILGHVSSLVEGAGKEFCGDPPECHAGRRSARGVGCHVGRV